MEAHDVIAERFEVERLAGTGGMGSVYRALDRLTGATVALKVLHASGHRETDRFAREGTMLAELSHPGIVRYVAHGVTGQDEPWLAMEWLEGEDLHHRLSRQGLTAREAVAMVTQVADALGVAHARGIIHRDIKPSNIFLVHGDARRAKVLDFGIARRGAAPSLAMTRTGALIGTPGYMAPEQARGSRSLDARADVFSLGCVLFECLAGHAPFVADNVMALLARILLEDAPRLREIRRDVPDALDELVARMLSKTPEERPRDGADVAGALTELGDVAGAAAPRSDRPDALTRGEQRVVSVVMVGGAMVPAPEDDSPSNLSAAPTAVVPVLRAKLVGTPAQGSTPGSDPQHVVRVLRDVVKTYGGRLEPLMDGSAVVTVSARGTATDQAARAARCALAIRVVLPEAPVALATGRGEVSARFPVGEVIDEAARALSRGDATPDVAAGTRRPVWINPVTARLLDARFEVTERDGQALLFAERDEADSSRLLLGRPTPCVGRERELATLEATFSECVEESVARALLLTAPPGVGKSRVRHEFLRRVAQREDDDVPAAVWVARGDPMRAGSAFGLLAQALRAATGVREGTALAERQHALRTYVSARVPPQHAARVTEFLGELVGAPFGDDASPALRAARQDAIVMSDQLMRAWLDFLAAECAAHPLLIVLEDLHWGDVPTVKFVDAALRELADKPLMALALARPEVAELFPKLWVERGVQELRLSELPRKACEKLVKQVLGASASADVIERVVAQSAGNAFYLEELIRAVAEGKGGSLPESVLAMAQARLDGLDPELRRSLRAASVYGQVFWSEGARALLGGERTTQLGESLNALVERELVTRRTESRFPGSTEYAFRHSLLREAAYEMLTAGDRVLGHRLAGEWLEKQGETEAVALAEHFERGEARERAAQWYLRGAEQALGGEDLDAVTARVDRGIACGASGQLLGSLLAVRTEALMWRGDYKESLARSVEANELLAPGSVPWFKSVGMTIWLSRNLNERTRLMRAVEVLLAHGNHDPPSGAQAQAWALSLWSLVLVRRYELVGTFVAWLEALRPHLADDDHGGHGWVSLGLYFARLHQGLPEDVYRLGQECTRHFDHVGDARNTLLARVNLGRAALAIGRSREAEDAMRAAIVTSERVNLRALTGVSRRFLAAALARRGAFDEARALVDQAAQFFEAENAAVMAGIWRIDCAVYLVMCGDVDGAERQVTQVMDAVAGTPPVRALALTTLARVALARRQGVEALVLVREAMALFAQVGAIGDHETFVRLVFAEALAQGGGAPEEVRAAVATVRTRVETAAATITDPELRRSFVEDVPENAQALALPV